jgi:glycopeptide antibiotics resistance protein
MIPRFLFPFLPYRSFFSPFLVLSAITVPCWLVFRLYRLRDSGHRVSLGREILLLTFVVYLSGLATATLLPNHNSRSAAAAAVGIDVHPSLASLTCSSTTLPRGSTARAFCIHNARGNVVLFFPLGILMPLVWRRLSFWRGILIAIGISCGIELVQFLSRAWINRNADVNDVILNVIGASIGLAFVFLIRLRQGRPPGNRFAAYPGHVCFPHGEQIPRA